MVQEEHGERFKTEIGNFNIFRKAFYYEAELLLRIDSVSDRESLGDLQWLLTLSRRISHGLERFEPLQSRMTQIEWLIAASVRVSGSERL